MAEYTIGELRKDSKLDIAFSLLILTLCFGLLYFPSWNKKDDSIAKTVTTKAIVENVDNSEVMNFGVINQGRQVLKLKITSGDFKGDSLEAENQLLGDIQIDYLFQKGDQALLSIKASDGEIDWIEIIGPNRLNTEILLIGIFIVVLIGVAGWTGIKALVSFFFAVLMIWKVLVPLCMKEYNPILVSLAVVTILSAIINFLIGGLTKRGLIAFLGASFGLLLTCGLAKVFSQGFHLNGAVRPFAKTILLRISTEIDITNIFIAGIFIACSGAVMDLAMDISAAMCEIKMHKPNISFSELSISGLRVGRAVIGTMTTTLLLAYSGGYTTLLMYFMAQGISPAKMFNSSFLSAEILNTLVGSFGLVTVAPLTAIVGSLILCRTNPEKLKAS